MESVRITLAHDPNTHVAVQIAPAVKDFKVRGEFEGVCVADLFDAICRRYEVKMRHQKSPHKCGLSLLFFTTKRDIS